MSTLKLTDMKAFTLSLIVLFLMGACTSREQQQQKLLLIDSLQQDINNLRAETMGKDSVINQFFITLSEIEKNLSLIKEKERIITKDVLASDELKGNVRERINTDIQIINDLMVRNRQSVRHLNNLLEQSNLRIDEFTRRVEAVTLMLEERDSTIIVLKEQLAANDFSIRTLNATVDTLTLEKSRLKDEVDRKTDALNTAWYCFGTRKELMDNGVIERAGGILGIGATIRLRSDFNEQYFTRINTTEQRSIQLYAGKIQIVTSHPLDSYELVRNSQNIVERIDILDENEFWSASKYLVVVVK